MNILGLPGLVGGAAPPLGGSNGAGAGANDGGGGAASGANGAGSGRSDAGASSAGDSGLVNDTSAAQTVSAPKAARQTAESRTAEAAKAILADIPAPTADERAFAEEAATRLFYESLIADLANAPTAPQVAAADPSEEAKAPTQAEADANEATERFKEGLKLVNERA